MCQPFFFGFDFVLPVSHISGLLVVNTNLLSVLPSVKAATAITKSLTATSHMMPGKQQAQSNQYQPCGHNVIPLSGFCKNRMPATISTTPTTIIKVEALMGSSPCQSRRNYSSHWVSRFRNLSAPQQWGQFQKLTSGLAAICWLQFFWCNFHWIRFLNFSIGLNPLNGYKIVTFSRFTHLTWKWFDYGTIKSCQVKPVRLSDEEIVTRVLTGKKELYEILLKRYNQTLYRAIEVIYPTAK